MSETSDNKYESWESSVEEPTRPRKGPHVATTVFPPGVYQGIAQQVVEKKVEPLQSERPPLTAFEQDLRFLINKRSMESLSGTPDSILAEYMVHCLNAFTLATRAREQWYGRRVLNG